MNDNYKPTFQRRYPQPSPPLRRRARHDTDSNLPVQSRRGAIRFLIYSQLKSPGEGARYT